MAKFDVYEMVTNKIIEQLEKGTVPWVKPWTGCYDGALSRSTGKPYSFINQLMLKHTGEYLTFKQIQELGGKVIKGQKSEQVVFYTPYKIKEKNPKTGIEEEKSIPILKYYNVFHISQCEGVEPKFNVIEPKVFNDILQAESLAGHYIGKNNITFEHVKGDNAYYMPLLDKIVLPEKQQLKSENMYYETLFHEMTHSTGHKSRLDRLDNTDVLGEKVEYSKEELIAEMGSAFIMAKLGLDNEKSTEQNANYIASWLRVLKNDKKFVVYAATKAEKAVGMIFDGFEYEQIAEEIAENVVVEEQVYYDNSIKEKLKDEEITCASGDYIKIDGKSLFKAIDDLSKLKVKSTSKTLEDIHVKVNSNSLNLRHSDLEKEINVNISLDQTAYVGRVFSFNEMVQIKKFLKKSDVVEIHLKDTEMKLVNGAMSMSVKVNNIEVEEEIPNIKTNEVSESFTSSDLINRYNKVKHAVSTNENKLVHTGVLFDKNKMVAVDGYRLSLSSGNDFELQSKYIVSYKTLKLVTDVFKKSKSINVEFSNIHVKFTDGNTEIISRLIEGEFLDYMKSIPTQYNLSEIDVKEMRNAVEQLAGFVGKGSKVPLRWGEHRMSLETNFGIQTVETKNCTLQNVTEIGFNPTYLLDALKTIDADTLTVRSNNSLSPIVFELENEIHLILPVRLKDKEVE